uniref:Uncharacterized protein n=1 Tax=viral metagenome TaxID=1070528 RepID=A0A6C0EDG7_9ZZZZ
MEKLNVLLLIWLIVFWYAIIFAPALTDSKAANIGHF